MIQIEHLFIIALAAFRLSEMIVIDNGPFDIFFNFRGWVNKPPVNKLIWLTISDAISCVHCIGVWTAGALALLSLLNNPVIDFIIFILAVSGLQSVIAGKLGRS